MEEISIEKKFAGGNIKITTYGISKAIALPLLEESYQEALLLQNIFNFYDQKSELSILNKIRSMTASSELLTVIKKALEFSPLTDGKYDISKGKNFIERKTSKPLSNLKCSYKDIKIEGNSIKLLHEDVLIDLGSIAKGYIVDKIVEFLINQGVKEGSVDARGDMRFFGNYPHIIEIQHPRIKNKTILPFKINNMSIATSGDYNQFFGDYNKSHIINQKDIISATVIAPTALDADVFASALYLVDENKRKSILRTNKKIIAILIDKNLYRKDYNGFSALLIKEDKNEVQI